ncbi:MAG: DEAD/DEAH box helicase [Paludibacteraceae bacterium]|nr:DEAD/DEAH box helicase [Paludibacteraceae bacterium]
MFAVVISEHRLWGYRFQPALLSQEGAERLSCIQLGGTNFPTEDLSELERKIVSLCEKYEERFVMRLFVKERLTVAEFQAKYIKNSSAYPQIAPFIEKNNYAIAALLRQHTIPVYLREKNYTSVYLSDRIEVLPQFARPVPSFQLTSEKMVYSLRVFHGESATPIPLKKRTIITLSTEPCCLLIGKKLCLFESMNYKRIMPFLEKDGIDVQLRTLPSYMKSFVVPTLEKEDIDADGFTVVHRIVSPKPILTLVEDLSLRPALSLSYDYEGEVCASETNKRRYVSLSDVDGYRFSVFERDEEKERYYADLLLDLGLVLINNYYYVHDIRRVEHHAYAIQDTIDFLVDHKSELSQFSLRQKMDLPQYVMEHPSIRFDVKEGENRDWFDIYAMVQVGRETFPFVLLRDHILDGICEYTLQSGKVFIIPQAWFAQYKDLFLYAEPSEDVEAPLSLRKCYVGMLDAGSSEPVRRFRGLLETKLEAPKSLKAILRDYQQVGYSWLCGLYENGFGGCLADDMGLGKTLQFLAFLLKIYEREETTSSDLESSSQTEVAAWPYESSQPSLFDQPLFDLPAVKQCMTHVEAKKPASLIVLPTSLLFNWVGEKSKFAPSLRHLLYVGDKRVPAKNIHRAFEHYDLIFTTYGVLRRDIEALKKYPFECVVMDESQNAKNVSSQTYKALMELNANHFFCMSGTPIENSLEDLWAQMNLANRGLLGTLESFKKNYVTPIVKRGNEDRTEKLKTLIKPFLLRRTKEEVAKDLPPIVEQLVYCEMNEAHKELYDREKSMVRNALMSMIFESGVNHNSILALSSLTRLRELSNHPKLLFEDSEVASEKMNEVVRRVLDLKSEGHKVLIFSSFVRHLDLLQRELELADVKYAKLTGATQQREEEVRKFQRNGDVTCFLISLKAGGVGLNLVEADYVFVLDPWWNPAAEMQAIDRAHRIGQDKKVFVYRFITKDSVEEKIRNLQTSKMELSDMFVNNNNPFSEIDPETLAELFS